MVNYVDDTRGAESSSFIDNKLPLFDVDKPPRKKEKSGASVPQNVSVYSYSGKHFILSKEVRTYTGGQNTCTSTHFIVFIF